jgi:hypothetical protein
MDAQNCVALNRHAANVLRVSREIQYAAATPVVTALNTLRSRPMKMC